MGGGAVALLAWEYPEVKKVLLLEAVPSVGPVQAREALKQYAGEIVVVAGGTEEALGPDMGKAFYDFVPNVSKKEMIILDNCDHQFRGEANGRIMSEAPIYAFADGPKIKFPDPKGGIKLYD